MIKKCVVTVALLVFAATGVEAGTYAIDPVHSDVGFSVRHMAISKVRGSFADFSGTFNFDPKDTSSWSCEATIQVASIDTDNEKRDGHLKSADFFDAEGHPTITFTSTKIVPKGGDKFEIQGDFTMRGVTKPVTLNAEFLGMMADGSRAGFTATGEINRMDYGVNWSKALETGGLVVSHEVEFTLDIQGAIQE